MPGLLLDRLHRRLRGRWFFQRFTLFTRAMLALGFLAPGLTKLVGRDFAPGIDPATPMGLFFDAFHGAGGYYLFVGAAQMGAATLLLSRRTALLGACLYLPIIANIFVLVTATRFGVGTPVMTGLMTLACGWLLVWDAHRLEPLVSPTARPEARAPEPPLWDLLVPSGVSVEGLARWLGRVGFTVAFVGGMGLTLFARGLLPAGWVMPTLLTVPLGSALTLAAWVVWWRRGARARVAP